MRIHLRTRKISFLICLASLAGEALLAANLKIEEQVLIVYNEVTPGPTSLRETAQRATQDLVVRLGLSHAMPAGNGWGGASEEAARVRLKTCASDLVVIATAKSEAQSAFSEDGSTILTVRKFGVDKILRTSSAAPGNEPSEILVSEIGGIVTVNGHKISVQQPYVHPIKAGGRYLLFLLTIPHAETFQAFPQSVFDLQNSSLTSTANGKDIAISERDALLEIEAAGTACPSSVSGGPALED